MKTKIVIALLLVLSFFLLNQADGADYMTRSGRFIGSVYGANSEYGSYRSKTGEVLRVSIRGKEHEGKVTAIEKFDIVIQTPKGNERLSRRELPEDINSRYVYYSPEQLEQMKKEYEQKSAAKKEESKVKKYYFTVSEVVKDGFLSNDHYHYDYWVAGKLKKFSNNELCKVEGVPTDSLVTGSEVHLSVTNNGVWKNPKTGEQFRLYQCVKDLTFK